MATVPPPAAIDSIERFGMTPEEFRRSLAGEVPSLPPPADLGISDPNLLTLYGWAWLKQRTYPILGVLALVHTYEGNERAFDAFRQVVTHRAPDVEDAVNDEIIALHREAHQLKDPHQALIWAKRREVLACIAHCMDSDELHAEIDGSDACVKEKVQALLKKAVDLNNELGRARDRGDWWGNSAQQ